MTTATGGEKQRGSVNSALEARELDPSEKGSWLPCEDHMGIRLAGGSSVVRNCSGAELTEEKFGGGIPASQGFGTWTASSGGKREARRFA